VQAAFAEEQIRGLELAARVRIVALAVVSVWVAIENDFPEAWVSVRGDGRVCHDSGHSRRGIS
jgi:hypothetical protein